MYIDIQISVLRSWNKNTTFILLLQNFWKLILSRSHRKKRITTNMKHCYFSKFRKISRLNLGIYSLKLFLNIWERNNYIYIIWQFVFLTTIQKYRFEYFRSFRNTYCVCFKLNKYTIIISLQNENDCVLLKVWCVFWK